MKNVPYYINKGKNDTFGNRLVMRIYKTKSVCSHITLHRFRFFLES